MRALKFCAAVILLVAMCGSPAKGDETSAFDGTITQAPAGNVFGVANDGFVQGNVDYPVVIGSNFNGTVNSFRITFDIGLAVYTEVVAPTGNQGSVTLTNGLITDIEVTFPSFPCVLGGAECPPLVLAGATFFTSPEDCQTGQVCGTLDFSNSQPQATPEPRTIWLLVCGLAGLMYWRREDLRVAWIAPGEVTSRKSLIGD